MGDARPAAGPLLLGALRRVLLTRQLSAVEATESCLRRIESAEDLRAFVTVASEQAVEHAAALDRLGMRARRRLALFGVPVAVKDELWTRGIRTTGGSRVFADFVPDRDAVAVERLRAAGAVIVGKTNTSEFGMSIRSRSDLAEECRHPLDRRRSAGGSSGGSAASVAAGLVPLALASDAGGSTRVPAALCGAIGLHPTFGRVARSGSFGRATLLGSVGPIAASVEDVALALQVIAGHAPVDPWSSERRVPSYARPLTALRSMRLGWWDVPASGPPPATDVVVAVREALERVLPSSWALRPASPPLAGVAAACQTISDADRAATVLPCVPQARRSELRPETRARLERGERTRAVAYADALSHRAHARSAARRLFDDVVLLASPAIGVTAPPLLDDCAAATEDPLLAQTFGFAGVANYLGCPAISLPCGAVGALPVALQLIAPPHADRLLIDAARALISEGLT